MTGSIDRRPAHRVGEYRCSAVITDALKLVRSTASCRCACWRLASSSDEATYCETDRPQQDGPLNRRGVLDLQQRA